MDKGADNKPDDPFASDRDGKGSPSSGTLRDKLQEAGSDAPPPLPGVPDGEAEAKPSKSASAKPTPTDSAPAKPTATKPASEADTSSANSKPDRRPRQPKSAKRSAKPREKKSSSPPPIQAAAAAAADKIEPFPLRGEAGRAKRAFPLNQAPAQLPGRLANPLSHQLPDQAPNQSSGQSPGQPNVEPSQRLELRADQTRKPNEVAKPGPTENQRLGRLETAAPARPVAPEPAGDPAADDASQTAPVTESRRTARRRSAGPARQRVAANDDTPSIGGLIYALNQKPSNRPFHVAAIASAVWLGLGLAIAYIVLAPEVATTSGNIIEIIRRTSILTTAATLIGPVSLFWFLAYLAWRSDELRMRSSAMTEVAVRLAEPDRTAEQQVASLGDAVRRQVNYMNEAVGMALGRAGELESMVQSEVGALERSYEENERKIRGLLQELASERNSLTGTGEHFQRTLAQLANDVPKLIEGLSTQQGRLAGIIANAGNNLTSLEASLSTQNDRLEATLDQRAGRFEEIIDEYVSGLGQSIDSRATEMKQILDARTEHLQSMFSKQNTDLDTALTGHATSMNDTLGTYTEALHTVLEKRGDQISGLIEKHSRSVDEELDRRMAEIDDKIGKRTETLQSVFEEYALALDTTLANRANALDKQLVERTKSLDDAFTERLRLFDEAIVRSTSAIDSAVGENARALTSAMEHHAESLSESISKQAVELDGTLMQGITQVRQTSENISRQSIRAIESLANQADMLKNVSENLLGQINTVTGRFETQGQNIMRSANALESANYKIDKALSERNEEINLTLDRMSGKADELGRVVQDYSSQLEGSVNEAGERTRLLTEELSREARERSRQTVDEFTRITSEASREKDRALDELKAEFATVTREVTDRLGVLSQQFANTSGEVRARARKAADDIRSDQERLRAQLDQLPAATRDSADAMRRALQDQLRALDRLTALAGKTGAGRDVTRAPVPVRQEDAPTAPPSQPAPAAPSDNNGTDRTRRFSNLTTALARELSQRKPRGPANKGNGQRSAQPSAQPSAKETAPNAESNGGRQWSVGDLLARASLDEEGPVTKGSALDVKTIAGAIDPNLAGAIWSRFRSGQRGFMVRSIYAQAAREVFDETAERYQKEAEFRANVDQFLDNFEIHLRDADARDPSGRAAQEDIVQDAGRVYLFLAHASQRLT
ncbi:MAG: hypothetical protein AAGC70_02330 [Pseudomonadota bacterium]